MQKENINFGVCEDEKGKHFTWKMGLKGSCKMLFVSRERKRVWASFKVKTIYLKFHCNNHIIPLSSKEHLILTITFLKFNHRNDHLKMETFTIESCLQL